jgi:hypothetical protein
MKRYIVTLTEAERTYLDAITRKRKADSVVVKRAFALLAADANQTNPATDQHIQQTYHLSLRTIERLRQRFVEDGMAIALNGKKRTVFKPKTFDGAVEAHLIALRCSNPPAGHARWTIELLTDQMVELNYVETIGRETVRTMLKKTSRAAVGE